jgi:NADH-quinone oxidoreductase subunit M
MFGKVDNPANASLPDLSARELATFVPLIVLAVWIGIYPSPFLTRIETSVGRVVARVNQVYGPAVARGADCAAPAQPAAAGNPPAGFTLTAPCAEAAAASPAPPAQAGSHR